MHNTNQIIEDLVIDYCLDALDFEQRVAFEKLMAQNNDLMAKVCAMMETMDTLEQSDTAALTRWKENTWPLLQNISLEKEMNLKQLPLINRFSDHQKWFEAMKPLLPKKPAPISMRVLTQTEEIMQALVISYIDIPEEEHNDMLESFIILEGECECRVGDKVIRLKAGGYLSIPLHEPHHVKVLSEHVVAVLQRINLPQGQS